MKWKFKKDAKPQGSSDGFWYDITMGGYIKPELLLDDDAQLKKLNNALEVVRDFEEAMENANLIDFQ